MKKFDISILLSGYRPQHWNRLYQLLQKLYAEENTREKIDYFNWTKVPSIWKRRFG